MSELAFLLDGVDLATYVDEIIAIDSDVPVIGNDIVIPKRPGATFRRKTVGVGALMLGVFIAGDDRAGGDPTVAQWLENFRALKAFVFTPDRTRTLLRRTTLPDGSTVDASSACTHPTLPRATKVGPRAATTVLTFNLLDGYLYGTADVTITSPGSRTVAGDARTSRMVITMAAGTLTNTTTGAVLSYDGPGTATIDVLTGTATSGGTDVSGHVSMPAAGHDFWFDLDPGVNVLTGTASIAYRPAYLP